MATIEDLVAVDAFLASDDKTLEGSQPDWAYNSGYGDYQLSWPIKDGGRIRSKLKFRIPVDDPEYPSISILFRNRMVTRIDRVRNSECEPNPPYAHHHGLPARVCGTHVHKWIHNRLHVERSGAWELPAREPLSDNITSVRQMFFWLCDHANVMIPSEERVLILPDLGFFGGR